MPVVFLCLTLPAASQTNTSFQYFYDDLGQLTKVVDSTGTVIEYVYDPVGNILQIKRSTVAAGTLAIFAFTPQRGGPGQIVTIQGQAFDPTPANNSVQFNGTPAQVFSASPATLSVTVPAAAMSGPISVTVASQTVTSTIKFTVLPIPVITSLSRKSALLGANFPNAQFPALTVTGINFTPDTTFALAPVTSPPAATFGRPTVDPSGTSATMSLTVGTSITGTFAVVATSPVGSSSVIPTPANRFTIVDPRSTADTDENGVPDVIKALFGVDVLDPKAFPPPLPSMFGQTESPAFTVLNEQAPQQPRVQAESPAFTVLNASTGIVRATLTSESPAFTILNGSPQRGTTFQAESSAFTVLNSSASTAKATFTVESSAFSVENSNTSRSGTQTFTTEGPFFSLLNGNASASPTNTAESGLFSLLNSPTSGSLSRGSLAVRNLRPLSPIKAQRGQSLREKRTRKGKSTKLVKAAHSKPGLLRAADAKSNLTTFQNEIKNSTLSAKKESPHGN